MIYDKNFETSIGLIDESTLLHSLYRKLCAVNTRIIFSGLLCLEVSARYALVVMFIKFWKPISTIVFMLFVPLVMCLTENHSIKLEFSLHF